MKKISKNELADNLEKAIHANVGMRGFHILLYGWMHFRKYGDQYRHAVTARDFLFAAEVHDLSLYAGYDLGKSHPDD